MTDKGGYRAARAAKKEKQKLIIRQKEKNVEACLQHFNTNK